MVLRNQINYSILLMMIYTLKIKNMTKAAVLREFELEKCLVILIK